MFDQMMLKFLREMLEKSGVNLDQATMKTLEGQFMADLNGNGQPDLFDKNVSPEQRQAILDKLKKLLEENGVSNLDIKPKVGENGVGMSYARAIEPGESDLQADLEFLKGGEKLKNSRAVSPMFEPKGARGWGDIFRIILLVLLAGIAVWYFLRYAS